jgi:hypothetical protein
MIFLDTVKNRSGSPTVSSFSVELEARDTSFFDGDFAILGAGAGHCMSAVLGAVAVHSMRVDFCELLITIIVLT